MNPGGGEITMTGQSTVDDSTQVSSSSIFWNQDVGCYPILETLFLVLSDGTLSSDLSLFPGNHLEYFWAQETFMAPISTVAPFKFKFQIHLKHMWIIGREWKKFFEITFCENAIVTCKDSSVYVAEIDFYYDTFPAFERQGSRRSITSFVYDELYSTSSDLCPPKEIRGVVIEDGTNPQWQTTMVKVNNNELELYLAPEYTQKIVADQVIKMYIWAGSGGLTHPYDTTITSTLHSTKLSEACKVQLTEKDETTVCTTATLTRKIDSFKWTIVRGTEKYVQFDIQDKLYTVEPSYCNFEFQFMYPPSSTIVAVPIPPATFQNLDYINDPKLVTFQSKRIIELDIFESDPGSSLVMTIMPINRVGQPAFSEESYVSFSYELLEFSTFACGRETVIWVGAEEIEIIEPYSEFETSIDFLTDVNMRFESSDSNCPVTGIQIQRTSGNGELTLTGSTVTYPRITPFAGTFTVTGFTKAMTNVLEKTISIKVCGNELISVKTESPITLVTTIGLTVIQNTTASFELSDLQCGPLTYLSINKTSSDTSLNAYIKESGDSVILGPDPLPAGVYSFILTTKSIGLRWASIEAEIIVCGFEKISVTPPAPFLFYQQTGDANYVQQALDLMNVFTSNITGCPIESFSMVSISNGTATVNKNIFEVNTSTLFNETFKVMAQSSGGVQAEGSVQVRVECGLVTSIDVLSPNETIEIKYNSPDVEQLIISAKTNKFPLCNVTTQMLKVQDSLGNDILVATGLLEFTPQTKDTESTVIQIMDKTTPRTLVFNLTFTAFNFVVQKQIETQVIILAKSGEQIQPPTFMFKFQDLIIEYGKTQTSQLPPIQFGDINSTTSVVIKNTAKIPESISLTKEGNSNVLVISNPTLSQVGSYVIEYELTGQKMSTTTKLTGIETQKIDIVAPAKEEEEKKVTLEITTGPKEETSQADNSAKQEDKTVQVQEKPSQDQKAQLSAQERNEKDRRESAEREIKENELKLQNSGFTTNKVIGVTFPGIDPAQIDKLEKLLGEKKQNKKQVKFFIEPKMEISKITQDGKITITFNQEMLAPKTIDINMFQKSISVKLISDQNPEDPIIGRFVAGNGISQATRLLQKDSTKQLGFNVTILNFDPLEINMILEFENPSAVSQSNKKDTMIATILQPSIFISAVTGEQMKKNRFEEDGIQLFYSIPPQIEKKLKEKLDVATEQAELSMTILGSGNILSSLVMKASMQKLFGLLRSMQLIVFSTLISVTFQPHTSFFFARVMEFAQVDFFDSEELYKHLFGFQKFRPLNSRFQEFGIETPNFIMNSGIYFLILAFLAFCVLIKIIINRIGIYYSHNKRVREFCMFIKSDDISLRLSSMTLSTEMYFDLIIAALLQVYTFLGGKSLGYSRKDFLMNGVEVFNILAAFFCLIACIAYPFYTRWCILKKFEEKSIGTFRVKTQLYPFWLTGIRTSTEGRALFNFYFLTRRAIVAVILICFSAQTYLQTAALLLLSLAKLSYLVVAMPHEYPQEQMIAIFNEVSIYLSTIALANLSNVGFPDYIKDSISWVLIFIVSGNVLGNIALVCSSSIFQAFNERQRSKTLKGQNKNIKEETETRKALLMQYPTKFEGLRQFHRFRKALNFCEDWRPHRDWLRHNKVDFSEFKEERRYQSLIKEFDLHKMAYIQKMKTALVFAHSKYALEQVRMKKIELKMKKKTMAPEALEFERIHLEKKKQEEMEKKKQEEMDKKIQMKLKNALKSKYFRNPNLKKLTSIREEEEGLSKRVPEDVPSVVQKQKKKIPQFFKDINSINKEINQISYKEVLEKEFNKLRQMELFQDIHQVTNMMQQANKDMLEIKCMENEISGPENGIKKDQLDRMIKVSMIQINSFFNGSFAPELYNNNNYQLENFYEHDDSQGEAKNQLYQLISIKGSEILGNFMKSDGICPFKMRNERIEITATLQCLLRDQSFAEAICIQVQISEEQVNILKLRQCYLDGFRYPMMTLGEEVAQMSQTSWMESFSRFAQQDATPLDFYSQFMTELLEQMTAIPHGIEIFKRQVGVMISSVRDTFCTHKNENLSFSSFLELRPSYSVLGSLRKFFKLKSSEHKCTTCGAQVMFEKIKLINPPEVLVLGFKGKTKREIIIEKSLDLSEFIGSSDSQNHSYHLYATIMLKESHLGYDTSIQNLSGSRWIQFDKDEKLSYFDINYTDQPHLLFYKRTDQQVENQVIPDHCSSSSDSSESLSESSSEDSEEEQKAPTQLVDAVVKKKKVKKVQIFDLAPSAEADRPLKEPKPLFTHEDIKKKIQKKSSKGFLDRPPEEPKPLLNEYDIKKSIKKQSSKGFLDIYGFGSKQEEEGNRYDNFMQNEEVKTHDYRSQKPERAIPNDFEDIEKDFTALPMDLNWRGDNEMEFDKESIMDSVQASSQKTKVTVKKKKKKAVAQK